MSRNWHFDEKLFLVDFSLFLKVISKNTGSQPRKICARNNQTSKFTENPTFNHSREHFLKALFIPGCDTLTTCSMHFYTQLSFLLKYAFFSLYIYDVE